MTRYHETSMHVRLGWFALVAVGLAAAVAPTIASAGITGLDLVGSANPNITLTAREGYISVADGGSVYSWGYAEGARDGGGTMQLPGPTLIVQQGARVNVRLYNDLPTAAGNVSIVFPGHVAKPCRRGQVDTVSGECTAVSGVTGGLVQEAQPGAFVDYTFVAGEPGTYQYHSGTQPDLQVEMGLYGALIVRPATVPAGCGAAAYSHPGACYDREYLYLLSEIDMDNLGTMPHQPYGSLTRMHPGERLLIRLVGAGREQHPFHTHGNHSRLLARDGRMLLNDVGNLAGPLLFTIPSVPGGTADAIFEWTGKDLGWDMYGHAPSDPLEPNEWAPDHGKEIPVTLPSLSSMAFGGFYSGSPYLGGMGSLPPGEGGLNPNAGFAYMWHSHTERELVNNDVFPGGMMTMLIVEAPDVVIP
jgi:FtsP/CotA-like multicopper oxidase with cupredoxin domain